MKVLVTGATGEIGANVIKRLVEKHYQVRALVRPNSTNLSKLHPFIKDIEVCAVDVCNRAELTEVVVGMDAVLHLAMHSFGPQEKRSNFGFIDVNVGSTLTLLEAVRSLNPGLQRFVCASSCVLYPQTGIRREATPFYGTCKHPSNIYAVSKLSQEHLTNVYHRQYGIPTVILRLPFTFCGRELMGERTKWVSPYIEDWADALAGRPQTEEVRTCVSELRRKLAEGCTWLLPIFPDGTPWRQQVGDVRDVAIACELALHAPKVIGKTCVIQSDAMDYAEGIPHLARLTGKAYTSVRIPVGDAYWYDMQRTEELLGYRSAYGSARMLEDAWRHLNGEDIGIVAGTCYPHRS